VLDDHGGRIAEGLNRPPGGVQIEQVVVGQLLAAQQFPAKRQCAGLRSIEGCCLVWILAIAQRCDSGQGQRERPRKRLRPGSRQIGAGLEEGMDSGIVIAGVGEGPDSQLTADFERNVACLPQQIGDPLVVIRAGDNGHALEVLGRRADQGDPANVDVLYSLVHGDVRALRGSRKGIEVADYHADRGVTMPAQIGHVLFGITGKDAGMDSGVEGLDPPAEHGRHPGDDLHRRDGQPFLLQGGGRPAAGDEIPAQFGQGAG